MNKTKFDPSHIKQFRASGLSQVDYCRQHGVKQATLAYWLSKSRPVAGFVAVTPRPQGEWLSLQWGSHGLRIKLNLEFPF